MGSVLVEAVEPGCPLLPGAEETLLGVAALLGSVLTSRAQQGRQGSGGKGDLHSNRTSLEWTPETQPPAALAPDEAGRISPSNCGC